MGLELENRPGLSAIDVGETILIVVVALSEPTKKSLVINGFDVPTSLEARGFTVGASGKKLLDQMEQQALF